MSYAINATNNGWRSIDSENDLLLGETYSELEPELIIPFAPNQKEFIKDIQFALGGIINANALAVAYPLFLGAIQNNDWDDVQILIIDAKNKSVITTDQYNSIKLVAAKNNIPISL